MKILCLHTDYIKFKPLKKALKKVAELSIKDKKEQEVKDALVVLISVEKRDSDVKAVVDKLVDEVKKTAGQVNVKSVVLYPYAHLSSDLGSPDVAVKILDGAKKKLSKEFKVVKAPFGYYKEFELKVKGHPLSELSREINVDVKELGYDSKKLLREISKSKLDASKLKDNDHRILAQQMDLFSFNEVAPGMVFWHDNGLVIRNELIRFWREIHRDNGYREISTPQILDKKLWQISGHWEKYKENIFLSDYERRDFAVKPMNCPGGMIVYKARTKSYRDLPMRVGELGVVHRMELSGTLGGLFRVIQFTQDDAHIFCTEKQMKDELLKIVKLAVLIYKKFGLKIDHIELSTRPEKRIGDEKMWDLAEDTLKDVMKKSKIDFKVNEGDGAFYGPKIDFHLKDSLGRTWQCATVQLDFAMPERFGLEYTDKDNKKKRPVTIHRVLFGSIERFFGILTEHYNGRFPTWLAPVQVRVLNFTDRNVKYAEKILSGLREKIPGLRVDFDFSNTTVSSKVKEAELMRVPYVVVVGDKEEKSKMLAVRVKGDKKIKSFSLEKFVGVVGKEVLERR